MPSAGGVYRDNPSHPSAAFVGTRQRRRENQDSPANPTSQSAIDVPGSITHFFKFRTGCERNGLFKPYAPMGSAFAKFAKSFITVAVHRIR
jgi:hypothetical protein